MTIACVARADAWVLGSALSLPKNKARGRSLQYLYQDKFLLLIPQATVQLLRKIRNRAMHISPETSGYVGRSSTWLAPGNNTMIENCSTDATSDPKGVQYLRIRPDWILNNLTKLAGLIQDCFIGTASGADIMFRTYSHFTGTAALPDCGERF